MATPTWTYADWITYDTGTSTRLQRLRLHIAEINQALRAEIAQYSIRGRELNPENSDLGLLLKDLTERERLEAEEVDLASGRRLGWTKGRARL